MSDINDPPLRRQIDRRIAETVAENVELRRQLNATNARVGAALREAATEGAGLVDGNVEAASVYGAILALAPDATAALDRALQQMRERCVKFLKADAEKTRAEADPDELEYWAVKQMQFAAGALDFAAGKIAALPLHEEPNNDAG